jgi:hypothetical protein
MADIAELGLKVDSSGIKQASGDLDRLAKSSTNAEQKAARMGKAIGTSIAAVATASIAAAGAIAVVVNRQRELIDSQAKLAQRLDTSYASISNLDRAGQLAGVSMGEITAASRALALNLGRAEQGSKAQTEALDRLGLSAKQLAGIPLDRRIATINTALRENVSSTERAAVAAELFGARSALAIQALDAGTISEAARQVEIFGLNLSDVDAAKVEMANDAFSVFGLAIDGIGKQMTVEFAPILKAVGDLFLQSAEEAGGMGNMVSDAADKAVTAISFVLSAGDGAVRVFKVVGSAGAVAFLALTSGAYDVAAAIIEGPTDAVNQLIKAMNSLGANIKLIEPPKLAQGMRQEAAAAAAAARIGMEDIDSILSKPLAGEAFRKFYEDAQASGQAAAEVAVAARGAGAAVASLGASAGEASAKVERLAKASNDLERANQSNADVIANLAEQIYQASLNSEELAKRQAVLRLNEYATPEQIAAVQQLAGELQRLDDAEKDRDKQKQNQQLLGQLDPIAGEEQRFATELENLRLLNEAKLLEDQRYLDLKGQAEREHIEQMRILQEQNFRSQSVENELLMASLDQLQQAGANALTGLITGANNGEEAMRALGGAILNEAVGAIVQMGIQYVKTAVMGQAAAATGAATALATGLATATALSAAYATPAALVSLATFGANAAAASAGIASTVAMSNALSMASFDGGGFTGNGSRTGGLDGKGGFMAMLHPRETVVDHTKGQTLGGGEAITIAPQITINGNPDRSTIAMIEKATADGARLAYQRISNDLATGRGDVSKSLQAGYGVGRRKS